jgi:hypothetical protein
MPTGFQPRKGGGDYRPLYRDAEVGERRQEGPADLGERLGADRVAVLQMADRVGRQHLEDALATPLVPDLLEPPLRLWALFAAVLIVTLRVLPCSTTPAEAIYHRAGRIRPVS